MAYNEGAKKVCVIGLGYIGLPTAALLASHGMRVTGVDINPAVVKTINDGMPAFNEPGLAELVKKGVESGCLRVSHLPEEADAFIICVPTPINSDKTANLFYVETAVKSIAPVLRKGNLVVLESTSPPGTVRDIVCPVLETSGLEAGKDFYAAYVPERAAPGKTLNELIDNSRIIGGINDESAKVAEEFYSIFVRGHISLTDDKTAETCKLMENTFRDVNIALANELAQMCENMGVNVWEAIRLANLHPRIHYHAPGPGVGGHCVAVDPWFLVNKQPGLANMIRRSRLTNDGMPAHSIKAIEEMLSGVEGDKKIVIMGASFKPDVDDIRESPILHLIRALEKRDGYTLALYEPHVNGLKHQIDDVYLAAEGADLIVLAVHHSCFKEIDWQIIASNMRTPMLYDTRNFMNPQEAAGAGFTKYRLLGSGKNMNV
jgi:UDP-N-acetyl-D-mannosaminuronic acid dehydrogenase